MVRHRFSNSYQQRGIRAFGYRIRIQHDGDPVPWDRRGIPTIWVPEGQLPPEWSEVQLDPTVKVAILYRSGKRLDMYVRP